MSGRAGGSIRPGRAKPSDRRTAKSSEHATVRTQHATEAAEDYCEAIAVLLDRDGEARVSSLARTFSLSHVTVSRVISRLQREGYVRTAPYRPIVLTPKGRTLGRASRERHEAVLAFLLALGVDERTARSDAEGIEHHVSPATLAAFVRFAGRMPSKARRGT